MIDEAYQQGNNALGDSLFTEQKQLFENMGGKMRVTEIKKLSEILADKRYEFKQYERLAGETEARNTEARLTLGAEARRNTPPRSTEDVTRDKQIVRFEGGRAEMAIGNHGEFVTFDGKTDIGMIDIVGYQKAPIRLEVGHSGAGLNHISDDRLTQLKSHGFNSFAEFAYHVANNYTEVRDDSGRLVIDIPIKNGAKAEMLVVELQLDDSQDYYSIITGLIVRSGFLSKKLLVAEVVRAEQQAFSGVGPTFNPTTNHATVAGQAPVVATSDNTTTPKLDVNTLKKQLTENSDAARLMDAGKVEVVQSVDDLPVEISEQVKRSVAPTADTIMVDGEERSTRNSKGQLIAQTEQGIINFWRWFSDSEVVDKAGNPLVVYHGTNSDFSAFDDGRLGENTDSNASSQNYAETSRVGFWFNTNPIAGSKSGYRADIPSYLAISNIKRVMSLDILAQDLENVSGREYRGELVADGYDGVVLSDEEFGGKSYVTFNPNQIKSAIGNNGNFDPNDNRILYSKNRKIQGLYDPQSDKTYLIADNLTPETVAGVFLHEVGVHAWFAHANDQQRKSLEVRALNILHEQHTGVMQELVNNVKLRMLSANETSGEEALAYLVEEGVNAYSKDRAQLSESGFVQWAGKVNPKFGAWLSDVISGFKASLFKIGFMSVNNLGVNDLIAVVKSNLSDVAKFSTPQTLEAAKVLASYESDLPTDHQIKSAQIEIEKQLVIADRLTEKYGYLPTPNGEKSNLNRLQWAQVRTPQFKAWFGDWENDADNASKVVDANGEPMVAYHGTNDRFDEFENTKNGLYFFSKFKEYADDYTNTSNVKHIFLNIRRIFDTREDAINDYYNKNLKNISFQRLNKINKGEVLMWNIAPNLRVDSIFDGFLVNESSSSSEIIAYAVKNPNQIKSAIDNVGTFSCQTNHIRFSKASCETGNEESYSNEIEFSSQERLNAMHQTMNQWYKEGRLGTPEYDELVNQINELESSLKQDHVLGM